jgi:hypothetical protein
MSIKYTIEEKEPWLYILQHFDNCFKILYLKKLGWFSKKPLCDIAYLVFTLPI